MTDLEIIQRILEENEFFPTEIGDLEMEIETWTGLGIHMFVNISDKNNFVSEFRGRIDSFDVDDEVMAHKQDPHFPFSLKDTIDDFIGYVNALQSTLDEIVKALDEGEDYFTKRDSLKAYSNLDIGEYVFIVRDNTRHLCLVSDVDTHVYLHSGEIGSESELTLEGYRVETIPAEKQEQLKALLTGFIENSL